MSTTAAKRARSPHQPVGCWCRPAKRLAVYLRDGMACGWCGATVEDGIALTLDHLTPQSKGGSNEASNLLSSCFKCNASRGNRSMAAFAKVVAAYLNHGATAAAILAHVRACTRRVLPKAEAKALIARRGSVLAVIAAKGQK